MTATPVLLITEAPGQRGIPLDVFATVAKVIGLAYPDAQMGPGEHGRGYTLHLPDRARAKRVTKKAAQEAVEHRDPDDVDASAVGWDGKSMNLTVPEQLAASLAPICMMLLEETEAVNYVELPVHHKETGERIVITVQRPRGKSPHELRADADAKVDAVLALVREWEADRDVCLAWIEDPAKHADPGHPKRLSDMADILNRHAEAARAALGVPAEA